MITKKIKCTNYNNEEVEEVAYFNLTKPELIDIEVSIAEGVEDFLKKVLKNNDRKSMIDFFKTLIFKSYGVKSEDGRRLIKSAALSEEFSQTEAYSTLFMELFTDQKAAETFLKGIMPKDIEFNEEAIQAKIAELSNS